ncbi:RDD family protein [Amycolatopsis sp. NPDC058986]|uniref:RDD family protein n=1 Tax=unclassified Amycolatopsis TaxID=2618356 RepID=UPI00367262BE
MEEESELVTGEAVVLDLRVAKLASRGVAMLLDVLVQGALLFGAIMLVVFALPVDDASLGVTLILVLFVLVMIGYPVIFETLTRGKSLGKLALGLRVVRTDGGPIRFRHALTRALAGFFVDFWALGFLGAVAVIVSLTSSNGRRVGDFLAGTVVIRERVPDSGQAGIMMPPGLEPWAAQLDLSRLPDELALAVRQYLARYTELRPEAAEALGYGLAQQVAERIGTPVPPGMPLWAYLSAVLAERRNRDHVRAMAAAPAPQAVAPHSGYGPAYPQPYPAPQPFAPQPGYGAAYPAPQPYGAPVGSWPPAAPPPPAPMPGASSAEPPAAPRPAQPESAPPPVENPFTPPS